ncbi:glucosaminidase domain-containing protein [Enterococcus rivorum]|uniref:glucosaminidase domain-containing protein n=1 Tax=Enterococcus rivorum TaxID=762845 RepID=UPI0036409C30
MYASVMIAQAILESGSGNSGLSVAPYYNLFGIKGSYEGSSVTMKTQEDDGKGNLYTIDSAFRQYPSYKESLEDYAKLLKEGLSGNSEFYKGTWKARPLITPKQLLF